MLSAPPMSGHLFALNLLSSTLANEVFHRTSATSIVVNSIKVQHKLHTDRPHFHPGFHGDHSESGEGSVEVHLERQCLRAEAMERGKVVVASTNVEAIVTAGTNSSTLEGKYKEKQ